MRSILARVAALALLALSACADPSAPAPREVVASPSLAVAGSSDFVATGKVLHRTDWKNYDITVSEYVRPERAATIEIRSAGLQVKIPKGAVSQTTLITVTAYRGNKVLYEFGPHGTQFNVPITIQQDLRETKAYGDMTLARDLFGGYTPNGAEDVATDGTVNVAETFLVELVPETSKRSARFARFYTTHFSGYVLASGRRAY